MGCETSGSFAGLNMMHKEWAFPMAIIVVASDVGF